VSDSVTYAGVGFRTSTATYIVLYLITPFYLLIVAIAKEWKFDQLG